jgi:hypothetical protein
MKGRLRDPWIDRRVMNVRVADMRDYMARHSWRPVPYTRPEVLMYEGPLADTGRPIRQMVPLLEEADDYTQCVIDLITNLARLEERTAVEVLEEMLDTAAPSPNGAANGQAAGTQTPARTT